MQEWPSGARTETAVPLNGAGTKGGDVWARFWLGITGVAGFVVLAVLLILATAGPKAAAACGLMLLVFTLSATAVDGIVLVRRRRR